MGAEPFLPFYKPLISQEEITQVIEALESGWLTTGPKTQQFEAAIARYVAAQCAVGVNSCTAALHLALVALGVGPGDAVITSPITFPATANVIEHCGARPIFIDVEPDTLLLDVQQLETFLASSHRRQREQGKLKAIIPVHLAGQPCDMDRIYALAAQHGLAVIEDAAHALGAEFQGQKVGSDYGLGFAGQWATCFSFYATKNITSGEGGMLTTDAAELADKIAILRLHGISRDAWKRYGIEGYQHWEVLYPGYKYNMFDLQAALALPQLAHLDTWQQRREAYVNRYNQAFADLDVLRPLQIKPNRRSAYHLYVIMVDDARLGVTRDELLNRLVGEGIGVGVHFRSLTIQQFYREKYGFARGDFPVAEEASERILSLPLYPAMTEGDVERVVRAVRSQVEGG
ncbi:MAG: DegT/DnrJ/EryC1/StrS aminotransferase family protein [Nitrospinae bacterium]|nr:DegT/DnrJ/EryC1/StrS aminotransferase family protein [Nitrospinota bacterium]